MKPKYLKTQVRRHQLVSAFGEEKPAKCPVWTIAISRGSGRRPTSPEAKGNTLLLVSDDADLGVRLWLAADHASLAFAQINHPSRLPSPAGPDRAAVIFLDLDLPALAGWEAAERLLQDELAPSLVLMTGRTGHFNLGAAIRAGAVLDKSAPPAEFLKQIGEIRAEWEVDWVDRKARQRLLLRWLRPYDWSEPVEPAPQHWGINE